MLIHVAASPGGRRTRLVTVQDVILVLYLFDICLASLSYSFARWPTISRVPNPIVSTKKFVHSTYFIIPYEAWRV